MQVSNVQRKASNQPVSKVQRKAKDRRDVEDQQEVGDPQPHCPIRQHAETIEQLTSDMVKALRDLRRDLESCTHCTPNCPFLRKYNATVSTALVRIAEEWQLQI